MIGNYGPFLDFRDEKKTGGSCLCDGLDLRKRRHPLSVELHASMTIGPGRDQLASMLSICEDAW